MVSSVGWTLFPGAFDGAGRHSDDSAIRSFSDNLLAVASLVTLRYYRVTKNVSDMLPPLGHEYIFPFLRWCEPAIC